MLKDKLGPDSLIASPHSCMCSLFQSLFVPIVSIVFYCLFSPLCSRVSAFFAVACGRLVLFRGASPRRCCWARLEVGLPALEQRLQQQQKAVEDLGAALEET